MKIEISESEGRQDFNDDDDEEVELLTSIREALD
jgi:hypothetical protein